MVNVFVYPLRKEEKCYKLLLFVNKMSLVVETKN